MQSYDLDIARSVLDFWIGESADDPKAVGKYEKRWYGGGEDLDSEIRTRFGDVHESATCDLLNHWCDSADGMLALVIVLDQFTRNMYRGSAAAFAQDSLARAYAYRAVRSGIDQEMSIVGRMFLYHPFHHSESISDQLFSVQCVESLHRAVTDDWREFMDECLQFFGSRLKIVQRFGRFPHRNEVLNRTSTPEEVEYLKNSPRYGQ